MSSKLGEILVREKLISSQQLREALEYQRTSGGRLGLNLVNLGIISDDVITAVLSRQYGVPTINLALFQIEEETIRLISQEVALKYSVLPISKVGATLTLAMADPTNVFAMDDIKFMTGLNVEPVIASEASLVIAIGKYYASDNQIDVFDISAISNIERFAPQVARNGNGKNGKSSNGKNGNGAAVDERLVESDLTVSLDRFQFDPNESEEFEVLEDNDEIDLAALAQASEDAPVVRLVNVLLVDSLRRGASDIHVEPYEKDFRIRFRIDGILYDVMHPPMKMRDALISRLKIMSKLDISEKRLPQDGRIKIKVKIDNRSRELDFRVSSLPTLFGEKVVLRLLDKDKLMLDMTKLGFEEASLEIFQRNISKPYGMVLVTGPTGSGKTNTLYSALQALNTSETNIMTAEDPVEFNLPGINQVQMKE
nr:Flp pilus assembly complex ATPase component TadA [Acidobacteriota bacterium]